MTITADPHWQKENTGFEFQHRGTMHVLRVLRAVSLHAIKYCPHHNLYYMLYHELFPACRQRCQVCGELFKCNIVLSTQRASKHWEIDDDSYVVVGGCHVSKRSIKMSLSCFCLMILARIKYAMCVERFARRLNLSSLLFEL